MASVTAVIAPTPSTPEPDPSLGGGSGGARPPRRPHRGGAASARHRAVHLAAVLAGALLLGGCKLPQFYAYRPVTRQENSAFTLYSSTVIAAIVVGLITAGLIVFAIFRYRRRSDAMPRQFQYHIPLEIFYTVVPIAIVLVLFGFTVATENTVDAVPANPPVKVTITAFQWGWKFDYTNQHRYVEGIRTENPDPIGIGGKSCTASAPNPAWCLGPGLVMPVGERVNILLVSNDVVHSFYVPQFLFSRQAIPGVNNRFAFTVDRVGIYRAQCNNICGLYHAEMFFHVVALPKAQFDAWVHSSQTLPDNQTAALPTGQQSATASVPSVNSNGATSTSPSPAGPTNSSGVVGNAGVKTGPVSSSGSSSAGVTSTKIGANTGGSAGATGSSSGGASLGGSSSSGNLVGGASHGSVPTGSGG